MTWLGNVPLFGQIGEYYDIAETWLVNMANEYILQIHSERMPPNGSGDTSYHYAHLRFLLITATVGTLIWTIADKRKNYNTAYYWLLVIIRYYVAMHALFYGIIKLFGQQMIFPPLSALATPLGDFLPMRLSWYFIGYSGPYQFFSGAVEFIAGLLLLYRRTSTLGAFVAASIFLNVMMLNLCYDIPVKLFSIHLFLLSNFLLLGDAQRLLNFFVFNKAVQPVQRIGLPTKQMRLAQIGLKIVFIGLFLIKPLYEFAIAFDQGASPPKLTTGIFSVDQFKGNAADSLRWKDVIFEANSSGSIQTADTLFRQRYRRGYFSYTFDTLKHTIAFKKFASDTSALFTMNYVMPDTNHIALRGKIRDDSVLVTLKRQKRHFQLTERQFHWVSEANR
ncbi:hypothetical protein [Spirosoma sp. KNUC1025]|uniref:hypothetical protein n=1 Tax=Spirosoma sp. KNUC1025 TaxID=2894082 RepID=UPI00386B4BA3|nr:hypothetical protein LN737_05300 [Spirosoma sp. KNUC1025]